MEMPSTCPVAGDGELLGGSHILPAGPAVHYHRPVVERPSEQVSGHSGANGADVPHVPHVDAHAYANRYADLYPCADAVAVGADHYGVAAGGVCLSQAAAQSRVPGLGHSSLATEPQGDNPEARLFYCPGGEGEIEPPINLA